MKIWKISTNKKYFWNFEKYLKNWKFNWKIFSKLKDIYTIEKYLKSLQNWKKI